MNITEIQAYDPTSNTEEAEWFYEDLQDLLELTAKTILKKKNESGRLTLFQFQNLLQNSSNQNSMLLVLRTDMPLFHSQWNTIKTPQGTGMQK